MEKRISFSYLGILFLCWTSVSTCKFAPSDKGSSKNITSHLFLGGNKCVVVQYQTITNHMAHIALAYEGSSWTSEYAYPLMLLQTLIGAYDRAAGKTVTSQLCHDVAAGELANSIGTFNTCYKDTGLFGLHAVDEKERIGDLTSCVRDLSRLADDFREEDPERAKIAPEATMLVGLDGDANACDIGRQLLTYGRRMTPAEIFRRIEELGVEDVRAAAHEVFHNNDHAMAAVGGIEGLPSYEWIRRKSY